ncbi:hypothetical protein SLS63_013488 [Diaporthe eres]|uniref:Heterokaryon incompatibility domain-containing protein n=1 Tax=Diaporthe eres TaxID=83184 RepID=A0ABR1NND4_DIAER
MDRLAKKWLFYGLLSTVLRDENGGLRQFDPRLQGRYDVQYVDTSELIQALSEWETFERQNRRGATLRLMEAESALEYARQVVRANLAAKAMPKTDRNSGRTEDGTGYKHEHVDNFCTRGQDGDVCQEVSFNKATLYKILRSVNSFNEEVEFPVFRATPETKVGQPTKWTLEIKSWNEVRRPAFATISHVWSDGLGNQACNGVHPCQLKFINLLLRQALKDPRQTAADGPGHWFWLDTLGIPVEDKPDRDTEEGSYGDSRPARNGRTSCYGMPAQGEFKALKKKAISQIHTVFKKAAQAIVIDKGLCSEDAGKDLAAVTMKVLTSNWMRRLWTLQEAYLSKKLFISFKYNPHSVSGIRNFDDLMTDLTDDNREEVKLLLSIAQLVRRRVFHNIMGKDRLRRLNEIEPRGSLLIANAWRAVRWRTTSKEEDETLALSTLLQLDYRSSIISDAGIEDNDAAKRDLMMQDFWKLIDKHYKGSIPPGIIFLPGDKLTGRGFRWAPRTWMSSHDEDHPYPLGVVNRPARLSGDDGLVVQYPGFMLHCRQGEEVISNVLGFNYAKENTFDFPVDREFHQWYRAEVADLDVHESHDHRHLLKRIQAEDRDSPIQLAVIISRPNPREMVPEIGLLVRVCDSVVSRDEYDSRQRTATEHYCKVIQRVRVARLVDYDDKVRASGLARTSKGADCYGEVLDAEQVWFVDGFEAEKGIYLNREGSTASGSTATAVGEEVAADLDEDEDAVQQNNSSWKYFAGMSRFALPRLRPRVEFQPKVVDAAESQGNEDGSSPQGPPKRAQTSMV